MIIDLEKKTYKLNHEALLFVNYHLSNLSVAMSFKKKRSIKPNAFSLTGSVKSLKRNEHVEFESSLERDFIHLLEHNPNVKTYYEQPLKIFFNQGVYIPDFLVEYNDGSKEIVEIKYRDDLRQNFSTYKPKFKGAKEFCNFNDMSFCIWTEDHIRTQYLKNIKFLANFSKSHVTYDFTDFTMLFDNLKKLGKTTPKELVEFTSSDPLKQAELIYILWNMAYKKYFHLDLSKNLNMNSEIIYEK